ncbi:MAG: hypothetical protein AB8B86_04545 [Pseudomonadales bacterium]
MKKHIVAALALGLASTLSLAEEADRPAADRVVKADKMLVPVALDRQAEIIAQSRMDDAMDRLNAKFSQDMDDKFSSRVASVDH